MHMPFLPGITSAATLAFRREEEMLRHVPDHEIERFYAAKIKPIKHQLDSEYMEQSTITSDFRMLVRTVTSCFVREQEPTLDLMQCESHMGDSHQSDNHGGDSHGVESHGTCKRSSPGKYYVVSKVIQDTESVVGI